MYGVVQGLQIGRSAQRWRTEIVERDRTSVIVLTADLGFYSGVLLAACSYGWPAHWARSLTRALEISRSEHPVVTVYDANLPFTDWRGGFERLIDVSPEQRILLASTSEGEELWRDVLRCGGYDLIPRAAGSLAFGRAIRFAWLSTLRAPEFTTAPLPAGLRP